MRNITIFTDGASRGNPGPGGWGAIISIPPAGADSFGLIVEIGGHEHATTNNRMELRAAIRALHYVQGHVTTKDMKLVIFTDSRYLINGATAWIYGWQKSGWKTKKRDDVLNKDLWEQLLHELQDLDLEWTYLSGHTNIPGNVRADTIATAYADGKKIQLYSGSAENYSIDLTLTQPDEAAEKEKKRDRSHANAKSYSYVSMVDGIVEFHKTWPECEARVKGARGAKYKKALNALDETRIVNEWRVHK